MSADSDKNRLHIENHNCNVNIFQAGSCPTIHQTAADTKSFSVDPVSSLSSPTEQDADRSSEETLPPLIEVHTHAREVMNGVVADCPLLEKFIALLSTCYSARDVGVQVINLMMEKPTIRKAQVVTSPFIKSVMTFAVHVKKGCSVSNIQRQINSQYEEVRRKKLLP